jgi:hypothetical protein
MMTRKDYVAVSEILAGYSQAMIDNFWWEDLVNDFALMFEADNPNFDRKRFIQACEEPED